MQLCLGRRHRDTRRLEGTEEAGARQTRAGAAAAAAIRRLPNLVALDLTGTPFDDDALAVLTGFSLGFETGVGGARGEAASSPPATGPPALRELSLEATRVTGRAGVLVDDEVPGDPLAVHARSS